VSYGANVGANHTSKAPDQECWPGEGAFLGLGINVKFPVDLSQAPYTVVAAGVTLLPQKVLYPFSLINTPALAHAGISPALNQIIPAWLLTDNLFAVQRTEGKFRARNRARRSQFDLRVFRPAIVDLMRAACRRLQTVPTPREIYTERDLEGLGKNFMLEAHRTSAMESYGLFIKYYALLSLKEQVTASLSQLPRESLNDLLRAPHSNRDWEHARQLLVNEMGIQDVVAALRQLPEILQRIARDVEQSKAKDDERGARIIEGYEHAHVAAAEDPFVLQARADMCRLEREVQELVERLLLSGETKAGTILCEEACYHLMDRGHNREMIFVDDEDRRAFLNLVQRYQQRFGFRIYHYCLMSNHFHLLVHLTHVLPSRAVAWIPAEFGNFFQECHRLPPLGCHVFGRRQATLANLGQTPPAPKAWQTGKLIFFLDTTRHATVVCG
jgi:hypothetical protein